MALERNEAGDPRRPAAEGDAAPTSGDIPFDPLGGAAPRCRHPAELTCGRGCRQTGASGLAPGSSLTAEYQAVRDILPHPWYSVCRTKNEAGDNKPAAMREGKTASQDLRVGLQYHEMITCEHCRSASSVGGTLSAMRGAWHSSRAR